MSRIEISRVTKTYGAVTALRDVTLTLEPGRIYGLLGRNGAGKSTLLGILTGRIFPDGGQALLDGAPLRENDEALGHVYMMGESDLYPDRMRVADVFRWTAAFYGGFDMERALALCRQFGLNPRSRHKELSTGYASIYKAITALCVDADFILMDEPVLGLDASHRELLYRSMLETYGERPRTFVLSTHLIEEAARLVEEVVILHRGRILENRSCQELLDSGYTVSGPAAAVDAYIAGRKVIGVDVLGGLKSACVLGSAGRESLPEGVEISRMNLQKLFIRLTEQEEGEA